MDTFIDKKRAKSEIKEFIEKIKEQKINLLSVVLFGSFAKDNFNEWSDIDVAIVSENLTGDIFDDRVMLMKLRKSIDLRIEPHPFLPEDWQDETNPFVAEIKKTGEKII